MGGALTGASKTSKPPDVIMRITAAQLVVTSHRFFRLEDTGLSLETSFSI